MSFADWFQSRKTPEATPLDPQSVGQREAEEAILLRLAAKVVEWKMTVPAILFLESVKPLNFIGSQAMVFFEPFVQTIFNFKDYDTLRIMMEKRENVERLLLKIEELDAAALRKEQEAKAARRSARGGRRWWWPFGPKSTQPGSPPEGPPTA
jgi:hypothetical protein